MTATAAAVVTSLVVTILIAAALAASAAYFIGLRHGVRLSKGTEKLALLLSAMNARQGQRPSASASPRPSLADGLREQQGRVETLNAASRLRDTKGAH